MRLTIRRNGRRISISRGIQELQHENARLTVELALARSDADEWKERYRYLIEQRMKADYRKRSSV